LVKPPFAAAEYVVSPDPPSGNDHIIAKKMGMAIAKSHAGLISAADITEELLADQTRFGVAYGCDGYNHPLGYGCGFGTPHIRRR